MQTEYGAVLGAKVFYWTPNSSEAMPLLWLCFFHFLFRLLVCLMDLCKAFVRGTFSHRSRCPCGWLYVQLGGDTLATYEERTPWVSSQLTSVTVIFLNYTYTACHVWSVDCRERFSTLSCFHVLLYPSNYRVLNADAFQQLGPNMAMPDPPRSRSPTGEANS